VAAGVRRPGRDVIGGIFARYSSLFTAAGYVTLVPVIQHDWKAVFREPWIKPST
jgi:hypothetical protein